MFMFTSTLSNLLTFMPIRIKKNPILEQRTINYTFNSVSLQGPVHRIDARDGGFRRAHSTNPPTNRDPAARDHLYRHTWSWVDCWNGDPLDRDCHPSPTPIFISFNRLAAQWHTEFDRHRHDWHWPAADLHNGLQPSHLIFRFLQRKS